MTQKEELTPKPPQDKRNQLAGLLTLILLGVLLLVFAAGKMTREPGARPQGVPSPVAPLGDSP